MKTPPALLTRSWLRPAMVGKRLLGKPFAARFDVNAAVPLDSADRDKLVMATRPGRSLQIWP
jgi:hypothetical protein